MIVMFVVLTIYNNYNNSHGQSPFIISLPYYYYFLKESSLLMKLRDGVKKKKTKIRY